MENESYNRLLKMIKDFEQEIIKLAGVGQQSNHKLIHYIDKDEKFTLIVNRKGHRNKDNLTLLLHSATEKSLMVRFDVNGSDHSNPPNDTRIPTPHLHIFSEEYDNGRIAIPLSKLSNKELEDELMDSLEFFMDYTNIHHKNAIIIPKLL
ncbi:hypothetical protein MT340_010110 [Staphylococcus sp. NRL 16/872]|nr:MULTISPECIES: hypothetical protein [unclassified Staphylococcus]MCJ1662631.1 hypothetical protein [Staphylococcus sp. NRL 18/288]MCJ1668735.1 hypothetical protein [Staphylococcus sp. NRL 19/737]WEN68949.1 hypothetical protein MT340_010110 [Staphylococcus sp. NRL 16/872]